MAASLCEKKQVHSQLLAKCFFGYQSLRSLCWYAQRNLIIAAVEFFAMPSILFLPPVKSIRIP
jgi:hypothetical protein